MKRILSVLLIAGCALAGARTAAAHADEAPASKAAGATGAKAEFVRNLDYAGDKLIQLAEAIPQEKYTWRPGEGVRSVSEVFLHAAFADMLLPTFMGAKMPEGVTFDPKHPDAFETSTTKKEDVIAAVKRGLDHLKAAGNSVADSDLDTMVETFLGTMSKRELLFFASAHNHEHLGQMIAYARMNGIAPPWSMKEAAKDSK
jgi:uncharacterized damage-inducible protein DinB